MHGNKRNNNKNRQQTDRFCLTKPMYIIVHIEMKFWRGLKSKAKILNCIKQKSAQHHIVRPLHGRGLISKRPLLIYFYPLRLLVVNNCPLGNLSRGPLSILGRGPLGPWMGRPKDGMCLLSTTQNCHFQTNVQWMQSPAQPCCFFSDWDTQRALW